MVTGTVSASTDFTGTVQAYACSLPQPVRCTLLASQDFVLGLPLSTMTTHTVLLHPLLRPGWELYVGTNGDFYQAALTPAVGDFSGAVEVAS